MRLKVNRQEFHPELLTLLEKQFHVENNNQLTNAQFQLVHAQSEIQLFEICPFMNYSHQAGSEAIYFVLFPMTSDDMELQTLMENFFNRDSAPQLTKFYIVQETHEIVDLLLKHCAQQYPGPSIADGALAFLSPLSFPSVFLQVLQI